MNYSQQINEIIKKNCDNEFIKITQLIKDYENNKNISDQHINAFYKMGECYKYGIRVLHNYNKYIEYMELASKYEHAKACYEMIKIHVDKKEYDIAQKYVDIIKKMTKLYNYNTEDDINEVLRMETVINAYKINNGKKINYDEIEKKIWKSIYNIKDDVFL